MSKSKESYDTVDDAYDALLETVGGNTAMNIEKGKTIYAQFSEYPDPPIEESCVEAMRRTPGGRKQLIVRCAKLVSTVLLKDFPRYLHDHRVRDLCADGYEAVIEAVDSWEAGHDTKLTTWVYRKVYHAMARRARKDMQEDDFATAKRHPDRIAEEFDEDFEPINPNVDDRTLFLEHCWSSERHMVWKAEFQGVLARCKDEEKVLLNLLLEGYNSVEIGRLLGVSQSKAYRDVTNLVTKIREKST